MVGYQLRFHPGLRRLAVVVASGELGNLLAVRATIGEHLANWHRYEDYRRMYAARSDLGGGVVLSQIHEFDYLYSLFGAPERVFALGGQWSELEIDVEDAASSLLQFTYGGRPLPVQLQQDYLQRPVSRRCEVIGDRGEAELDFAALTLTVHRETGQAELESFEGFDRNEMFLDELRHFFACVEKRERPIVDLDEGRQSLRMALAVKESIASGSIVELAGEARRAY